MNKSSDDIDFSGELFDFYNNLIEVVSERLKTIPGVQKVNVSKSKNKNNFLFIITANGYCRSDFETEFTIYFDFGDINRMIISGKRPDWNNGFDYQLVSEKFQYKFMYSKILTEAELVFG